MLHPLSLLRPLTRCAPRTAPVRLDALLRRRARAGAAPPHQQAQRARQRANRAAVCRPALPLRLALAVALTFAHFALLSPSSPFLPSSPPTSPRPEPEPGTSVRRSALPPSSEPHYSPRSLLPTTRSPSEPPPRAASSSAHLHMCSTARDLWLINRRHTGTTKDGRHTPQAQPHRAPRGLSASALDPPTRDTRARHRQAGAHIRTGQTLGRGG